MLDRFRVLASGLDHPEGVCVGPDGRIWAGGEAGQIYAVTEGRAQVVARTGGFVLGLAVDAKSRIYACDVAQGNVMRVTLGQDEIPHDARAQSDAAADADALVEPYARFDTAAADASTGASGVAGMAAPNWLAFAPDGSLFVTDSGDWGAGDGRIWRIGPDRHASVWSTAANRLPNGCCLDANASAIFVIETNMPGVVRIPIMGDGSAGPPETVAPLDGTVPDGLALLADGSLLVACYRPDAILRIDPEGRIETVVADPTGQLLGAPTNVAFTEGVDGRRDRLVVANLGRWHVVVGDVPFEGAPLTYPDLP